MADIYDELGNRIQLTDELGRPVQLTDEYGHPMQLTGVAATVSEADAGVVETGVGAPSTTVTHPQGGALPTEEVVHGDRHRMGEQLRRSSSSSSSSSEDDGQGGRKKKGLRQKLKEILPGKRKDERTPQTGIYSVPLSHAIPPGGESQEHEKGIMEKIKEKLPGTHHNH